MTLSWGDAKGVQTPEKKEIKRIKIDTGGEAIVRLIGNVLPRYVYWITTKEGKKMPVECLQFLRGEERFDNSQSDPMSEVDDAIFNEKPQFAYVCNVIERPKGTNPEDNKEIKLFDLKRTIYTQIVECAQKPDLKAA